jgi:transposase-like protein
MPRRYPPEFRRKVLELPKAERSVAEVARELEVSTQTIYNWRDQDRIDSGLKPGVTSSDQAELAATRRAAELVKEAVSPKGGSEETPLEPQT